MKLSKPIVIISLAFSLMACASKIVIPTSGATANLTVKVANFAEKQSILNNESVWFNITKKDESWGGQQVIKPKEPVQEFTVPANETLGYSLKLLQGGGGFDSTCALHLDMLPPENSDLKLDFFLERMNSDEKITGCVAKLYSNGKLIGDYKGGATITHYTVKFLY